MKRIILGITGASGAVYGLRAARALLDLDCELHLVLSRQGSNVARHELGQSFESMIVQSGALRGSLIQHDADDYFAPIASGSFAVDGMLILPCSMACMGALANGSGGDLLRRAADVQLKEHRPLVLVFREMPLSDIHLENMLRVSRAGARVMPAAPAWYGKPKQLEDLVDFVAGRALEALGIKNALAPEWSGTRAP